MNRLRIYAQKGRYAQNDRGAALITVLLLVAVMAAGATLTFEALGYSIKRSTARRIFDQAQYYALGGEQLALAAAEKLHKSNAQLLEPKAVSYPIEGGRIDGVIEDGSNCFNINSLVERRQEGLVERDVTAGQYIRLLTMLGYANRQARRLSAALVDWLDSDNRPSPLGAEDFDYSNLTPPYRTADSLIADITELYLIRGYTPEVMAAIVPYLCVADNTAQMTLNVNGLKPADALLLSVLVGGKFNLKAASEAIAVRPPGGYSDIADFWREKAFSGFVVDQAVRAQTTVKPHRFVSRVRVQYHEAVSHLTSVIDVDDAGKSKLGSHQFGVIQ